MTYDNILRLSDDPDVNNVIKFLRQREINHFQRFGEAMQLLREKLNQKNVYYMNPARENLVCLIVEHDHRAALARGELLADIARQALGNRKPDIVSALGRAGHRIRDALNDARAEAQHILRVEGIHARGRFAAAVADHLRHRHARIAAAVVAPLARFIRIAVMQNHCHHEGKVAYPENH